jgi:hypothetical protein
MDRDPLRRQAALRARASEAILAALAAADARAPSVGAAVADAIAAVELVCWDFNLDPGDRLALIDDALLLMTPLKELAGAAQSARPALIVESLQRTGDLLRQYARLTRAV